MCGRYVQHSRLETLVRQFEVDEVLLDAWTAEYNVAPTVSAPVIFLKERRILQAMTWGLIPPWARDGAERPLINARSETVHQKPSFRTLFEGRRCIVPANGFYEWKREANGRKKPYYFHPKEEGGLFAFAGLWDRLPDDSGTERLAFTLLTTQANRTVGAIHDRMPVILRDGVEAWLGPETSRDELRSLCRSLPDEEMACHAVSPRVNSAAEHGAELIQPAPEQGTLL